MMRSLRLRRVAGLTTYRLARPPLSGVVRPRAVLLAVISSALALIMLAVSVSVGDYRLPMRDVVRAVGGLGDPGTLLIIQQLRLPRALVALLVGAAFGMSGAVLQSLTRNPLASPDIMGIAQGASVAVVAGIVVGFGGSLSTHLLALTGGLGAAAVIYLLAWTRGSNGFPIVLVGIGVAALCLAVTQYLLIRAQSVQAEQAMVWMIGSLNGRDWAQVAPLAAAVAVLAPLALSTTRWLVLLGLGDDTARGLGVPVGPARLALLLISVGLAAFATAAAGPIGFVALLSPHIARRLAEVADPPVVGSALIGSVLVLASDLLARVLPGGQLPVGLITAALGAPFLLVLLARANRASWGE